MKYKEIEKLSEKDKEKKLKDLKLELVKAQVQTTGSSKVRQIKKIIARIHTSNSSVKSGEANK